VTRGSTQINCIDKWQTCLQSHCANPASTLQRRSMPKQAHDEVAGPSCDAPPNVQQPASRRAAYRVKTKQ